MRADESTQLSETAIYDPCDAGTGNCGILWDDLTRFRKARFWGKRWLRWLFGLPVPPLVLPCGKVEPVLFGPSIADQWAAGCSLIFDGDGDYVELGGD